MKKVRGVEKRNSGVAALTGLCFLLFCILVYTMWPEGMLLFRRLIFPGDLSVTAAAFDELTSELKSGADILASLKGFCMTILANA